MKRLITTLLFLINGFMLFAELPDSLVVKDNSWAFLDSYQYEYLIIKKPKNYILYQTYSFERDKKGKKKSANRKKIGKVTFESVEKLMLTLSNNEYSEKLSIRNFGYDEQWLESNAKDLFKYIQNKSDRWTDLQKEFTIKQLSIYQNYEDAIKRKIGREGYAVLAKDGGTSFSVTVYKNGLETLKIKADEKPFGMPWLIGSSQSYNPEIPKIISNILPDNNSFNKDRFSAHEGLIASLAQQIYNDKCSKQMKKLAALEFEKELSELSPTFNILESVEYGYRGRYVGDSPQVFRVTLQNAEMPENVVLQYFVTRQGNTIYARDSLLIDYKQIINRIQSVGFLMDYLDADTRRKLEIFYYDNKGVNDYIIDRFNKNQEEWEKYDKLYTNSKFEHLYCGCNFRLDNNDLNEAIMFELTDEFNNTSIWLLLPDGTPVLHFFQGDRAYKYSSQYYETKGKGVQYACKKFNKKGEVINK